MMGASDGILTDEHLIVGYGSGDPTRAEKQRWGQNLASCAPRRRGSGCYPERDFCAYKRCRSTAATQA